MGDRVVVEEEAGQHTCPGADRRMVRMVWMVMVVFAPVSRGVRYW
jgi:hypothetical protein